MKTLLNLYRGEDLQANAMSCAVEFVKISPVEKLMEFYLVAKARFRIFYQACDILKNIKLVYKQKKQFIHIRIC
jgi:hypothetical protein